MRTGIVFIFHGRVLPEVEVARSGIAMTGCGHGLWSEVCVARSGCGQRYVGVARTGRSECREGREQVVVSAGRGEKVVSAERGENR
jgi:hypothetical protein